MTEPVSTDDPDTGSDVATALAAAVSVDAPPAPSIEDVMRQGHAARRRRRALRAGGATTAAAVLAGVALGVPAVTGGGAAAVSQVGPAAPPTSRPTPRSPEPSVRVPSIPGMPVPSPPVPGSTTCTPGPVKDLTDRHARLASMCLPSQLPRWSYRRQVDRPSRGGSTFFLADGPQTTYRIGKGGSYYISGGGGSVTMQAFASTTPVLAGTGDFNPGPGGRVGPRRGDDYLQFVT